MKPRVSICVPNLNNRPYLPERFETIFNQTFQDWELIVIDCCSDDGAWEYIQDLASREPRMRISQMPRGMYATWNRCIQLSVGEYIYMATSDDTMALDCLEKMISALEDHQECELAHCPLKTIDGSGIDQGDAWFSESLFARSAPDLVRRKHIRRAPFDGLLHLNGYFSVYTSITELLIRRSIFDKTGYFQTEIGSVADYGWNMRAALLGSTIHVPDTWAGWRRHPMQSTAHVNPWSEEHQQKVRLMLDYAVQVCRPHLAGDIVRGIDSGWGHYFQQKNKFNAAMGARTTSMERLMFIVTQTLRGSRVAREYLGWRLRRKRDWHRSEGEIVQEWLASIGFGLPLMALE